MYCVRLGGVFEKEVQAKGYKDALKKALKSEGFKASIASDGETATGSATVINLESKIEKDFFLNHILWVG